MSHWVFCQEEPVLAGLKRLCPDGINVCFDNATWRWKNTESPMFWLLGRDHFMVSFGGRYDELAEHCTVHTQHRFEFEFVVIYEEKWHFFVSSAWSQLWSNHVGYLHILLAACTCSTVQSTRPIPLRGALVVSVVSFPKMIFASLAKWHTTRATAGWRWDFGVLAKILVSWVMLAP